MLVLTRKIGEAIQIGERVQVKVVDIKGGQVRLGIEAPEETRIYREEIYRKVMRENQLAMNWEMGDVRSLTEHFENQGKE